MICKLTKRYLNHNVELSCDTSLFVSLGIRYGYLHKEEHLLEILSNIWEHDYLMF